MSWFAVGAEIGGLAECLFFLLGPIALMYNEKFKIASLINKFHFHKEEDEFRDSVTLNPIKLRFKQILFSCFYNFKKPNCLQKCLGFDKKPVFEKGKAKVDEELNIVSLI